MGEIKRMAGQTRWLGAGWIVVGVAQGLLLDAYVSMVWLAGGLGLLVGVLNRIHTLAAAADPE